MDTAPDATFGLKIPLVKQLSYFSTTQKCEIQD